MKKIAAILLASTMLTATAWADEAPAPATALHAANVPQAAPEDKNVRIIAYNPRARVRITGNVGRATMITFGSTEQVKRIVFGDAVGDADTSNIWRAASPDEIKEAPLLNNVHLWPNRPGYTNIQIVTAVDNGPDRVYQFAALATALPDACQKDPNAACDDPNATYSLTFTYPAQERAARQAAAAVQREQRIADAPVRRERVVFATARSRLRTAHYDGADRNWCWKAQGDALLAPNLNGTSDNRQEVTIDYRGRPIPAFFLVGPDGKDSETIMPNVRDGLVVLPVAPRIRTRINDLVLDLINCAEDQTPYDPGTYTNRPDVYRVVRRASQ